MVVFSHAMHERMKSETPLAARMRPRTLDEFIGQGKAKLERRRLYQTKTIPFVKKIVETLD
jgi:replication-associated recombination protein RarA